MFLTATDLSRRLASRTLFSGVAFHVDDGERIALIGPNGGGKSTLLRMLAGVEEPDEGRITAARGVRRVLVPQQDLLPLESTPRTCTAGAAIESASVHGDLHEAETLGALILSKLGFDESMMDTPISRLSGGWRKRLSIACGLARADGTPELLLLDEPTNHLDVAGIEWLEALLGRGVGDLRAGACVFISHDRAFIAAVATRVVELNTAFAGGSLTVDGDYREFVRRRGETLDAQARAQSTLANEVRRDDVWLARGAQARRTKAKFRIEDSAARRSELAAITGRNAAASAGGPGVDFTASGRRTRRLVQATGIAKRFGDRTLFRDLDLELVPGARLGLLGPNGAGKTTLIRVLSGELAPDEGSIRFADPPPRIVTLRQNRHELPPTTLLRDAISPGGEVVHFRDRTLHIKAWARIFLFRDEQLLQPISTLSGGEHARAFMARMMLEPADVLILDEPTNDLDIPTLEVLEESIESFPGAVVLVTHDRAMLERVATTIVVLGAADGSTAVVTDLTQALASLRRLEQTAAGRDSQTQAPGAASSAPTAPTAPTAPGRSSALPAPPVASGASPPSVAPPPRRTGRTLSFNEQRELDGMEAAITAAQEAVAKAERRVSDPAVVRDHAALARACEELEAAQSRERALFDRWQELETKRSG